jgi:Plasmid pRiA4b ORF-3-like protein
MAVYKFRISFEDYDDITREIEVKSNQSFLDLHKAIHQSIAFDGNGSASFYMSNDHWHKGKEITHRKEEQKNEKISLMEDSILKNFIVDPHQKIYYVFNFEKPWVFHIQLIKITVNEDPKATYPQAVKSVGEAPKQFGNVPIISSSNNEDLDFLNEMEYGDDEEERDEMGFDDGGVADDEEEQTEGEEFGTDMEEDI